jgi:hypothetical protein
VAGVRQGGEGVDAGLAEFKFLFALDPAAIDLATDQCARCGADDRASCTFAFGIDGVADQCSAGASDNQSDGAVGTLATISAVVVLPDAAIVTLSFGQAEIWDDRNGQACGGHGQKNPTH